MPHGSFTWYEVMTTDMEAAAAFYTQVAGWGTQAVPNSDAPYTLFTVDRPVAGLMDLPQDARAAGLPPFWLGYVTVDDVDATAAKAGDLGGKVHVEPRDIPSIGRFAVIADPQGAALGLFRWADAAMGQPQQPDRPGHVGWHELAATDWQAAFGFYSALFGWTKDRAVDIGEMGTYQLFAQGGTAIGGMFNRPPALPVPCWLYYVCVDEIEAAAERVRNAGGQVLNGPMQVPGGSWILQAKDPQGALFALVAMNRQA